MFKNKTGIMKNIAKVAQVKFILIMMTVSERLRSCWGPTRPAHHGDLRSSQWNMPQWLHQLPLEWKKRTCSDILSDALSGRPHQSLQPALSFREIFMHEDFSEFEFSCRSSIKHSPWAVCSVIVMWKKVCVFLWATIRPDFPEQFTSTFCIRDQ